MTLQYGALRVACWSSTAASTYTLTHSNALGYPHAHTHAHACMHKPVRNTYCFSTATVIHERA
jgi:hypothetical protein